MVFIWAALKKVLFSIVGVLPAGDVGRRTAAQRTHSRHATGRAVVEAAQRECDADAKHYFSGYYFISTYNRTT